jgi:predicted ATPase
MHSFLETLPNNVTIILNSRNRSNLEGETIVDIKGLSQEDAVKLFIQMAKRHLTAPISSEMESKINEICQLVEGHPLAIKLVGGAYKGGGAGRLSEMHDELYSAIKNMREPTDRLQSIMPVLTIRIEDCLPNSGKECHG